MDKWEGSADGKSATFNNNFCILIIWSSVINDMQDCDRMTKMVNAIGVYLEGRETLPYKKRQ